MEPIKLYRMGTDLVVWPEFTPACVATGRDPHAAADLIIALLGADLERSGVNKTGKLILAPTSERTHAFYLHEVRSAWLRLPRSPHLVG